jgi:predicted molibdopterin-dependent oxidoreductase YjgC
MDFKIVPSVCSYCGTGCGILFLVLDGKVVGTMPMKTHPVNEGRLCIKGWNLHEHVNSFIRLKTPLIRKDGRFQKSTWQGAIGFTADRLKAIVQEHGPDSVGVLVSAKMTNEENYLAQKFARAAIGTNNVDHCARL